MDRQERKVIDLMYDTLWRRFYAEVGATKESIPEFYRLLYLKEDKDYAEQTVDGILCDVAAKAMKLRFQQQREKGYGDWLEDNEELGTTKEQLIQRLEENIADNDFVDVLCLAAFLFWKVNV